MTESYRTLSRPAYATLEVKKSEFIAVASPVTTEGQAFDCLNQIKARHPKARHTAYAFVLREDARCRHSDDGEPAKTAGLPILSAINGAGVTDCIVTVTRYFGGTLLGTGGLVRAYGGAASQALQAAEILTVRLCVQLDITLDYSYYDQVVRALTLGQARMEDPAFTDTVQIRAVMRAEQAEELTTQITEITRGSAGIQAGEPFYRPI